MQSTTQHFIISGGPSTGKTTIIDYILNNEQTLRERHNGLSIAVVHEAAAEIIQRELPYIEAPWAQPDFECKVIDLQNQHRQQLLKSRANVTFSDRSPIDPLTYYKLFKKTQLRNKEVKEKIKVAVKQAKEFYNKKVFILDTLNACETNEIRHENLEEALIIGQALENEYKKQKFKVIHVPNETVEERVSFIFSEIQSELTLPGK